jgi:hypothetical protein
MPMRQMDLYTDVRDESGAALVPLPGEVTDLPASICQLVENTNGNVASGQQRLVMTDDAADALHQFALHSIAVYGWEAGATLVLKNVAKDQSYRPRFSFDEHGRPSGGWLVWLLLDEHRAALRETFARERSHGRQDDYAEGGDDE